MYIKYNVLNKDCPSTCVWVFLRKNRSNGVMFKKRPNFLNSAPTSTEGV